MSSEPNLLQIVWLFQLRLGIFFTIHGRFHFLCIESFCVDSGCVHLFQFLNVCDQYVSFPDSRREQRISKEFSWQDLRTKLMHSMESAHHFSSRPDCNNTADVPSSILRTALSAIPFVPDVCRVDVRWLQDNSSQDLPDAKELPI